MITCHCALPHSTLPQCGLNADDADAYDDDADTGTDDAHMLFIAPQKPFSMYTDDADAADTDDTDAADTDNTDDADADKTDAAHMSLRIAPQ